VFEFGSCSMRARSTIRKKEKEEGGGEERKSLWARWAGCGVLFGSTFTFFLRRVRLRSVGCVSEGAARGGRGSPKRRKEERKEKGGGGGRRGEESINTTGSARGDPAVSCFVSTY